MKILTTFFSDDEIRQAQVCFADDEAYQHYKVFATSDKSSHTKNFNHESDAEEYAENWVQGV